MGRNKDLPGWVVASLLVSCVAEVAVLPAQATHMQVNLAFAGEVLTLAFGTIMLYCDDVLNKIWPGELEETEEEEEEEGT